MDRAAGHVMDNQPPHQRQDGEPQQGVAGRRPQQRGRRGGRHRSRRRQEPSGATGPAHLQARELQPLAGDGQDDEPGQPGQGRRHRQAPQPQQRTTSGQHRSEGLDEHGVVVLTAPERDVDGGHRRGSRNEQGLAHPQGRRADEEEAAGAEQGRRGEPHWAPQRHRTLERDQGPDKAQHEQEAVHGGQAL